MPRERQKGRQSLAAYFFVVSLQGERAGRVYMRARGCSSFPRKRLHSVRFYASLTLFFLGTLSLRLPRRKLLEKENSPTCFPFPTNGIFRREILCNCFRSGFEFVEQGGRFDCIISFSRRITFDAVDGDTREKFAVSRQLG